MRLILAGILMTTLLQAEPAPPVQSTFESNGVAIPYDLYRPPPTDRPAGSVVLLHGADGMQYETWTQRYQKLASALAQSGFTVLVPHYFARTGTTRAADRTTIVQNFLPWAEAIADAVTLAGKQPGADPKRIGLVGISLGASLANSLATQDPRIAAVVDCFGTLPEWVEQHATRFAPTLILHGEDDSIVPVSNAAELENALKAHHIEYEIKIYPNQGHGFNGTALGDAERRTVAFLKRQLG
jgi:dipeptidyl aminopeptidase/acylaminoacyl peptidase